MKVPRIINTHDIDGKLLKSEVVEHDYGVSFADLLTICDIDGHETKRIYGVEGSYGYPVSGYKKPNKYIEQCVVCNKRRDVEEAYGFYVPNQHGTWDWYTPPTKYSEWYNGPICYECDENVYGCQINPKQECSNCGKLRDSSIEYIYTDGNNLVYDCQKCGERRQPVNVAIDI